MLAEAAEAGVVRADVPSTLLAAHIGTAFETAMRDWAKRRSDNAPGHVRLMLNLTFHGIAAY